MKSALIILDMARGYGWQPGSFGYDMVARVRRLKDAALAAGAQVIHVNSMRRPTDGVANADCRSTGWRMSIADRRIGECRLSIDGLANADWLLIDE